MGRREKFYRRIECAIPKMTLVFLLLLSATSQAQNNEHRQYWFDVSSRFSITKNLSITPEVGYRTEPSVQLHQYYLRTYFSYRPNDRVNLSLWAAQFNSQLADGRQAIEIRTSQFVTIYWPKLGGFRLVNRFGFDQRLFCSANYELKKQVHRSRVQIGLHTPNFAVFGSPKKIYANGSFEVLRNMNQLETRQWIDHDWVSVTLGYRLTDNLKVEANMLLINFLDPITNEFEREITVFRLRAKYSLQ